MATTAHVWPDGRGVTRVSNSIRSLRTNRICLLIRIQYHDSSIIRICPRNILVPRKCVSKCVSRAVKTDAGREWKVLCFDL